MTNGIFLLKPGIATYNDGTLKKSDQYWQAFKPELDVAKQFGREIFRPELARKGKS
jgi:hypothetical protein